MSDPGATSAASVPPPAELTAIQRAQIAENKRKAKAKLTQASPDTPAAPPKRRRRDNALSRGYCEYDLTQMVDSRGGFILPELYPKGLMADELSRIKPVEKTLLEDLPIPLDRDLAPKCRECGSLDVDPLFFKIFTLTVCPACKQAHPEKYSLITKTEAKQDYLLTDEELRDAAILPHWEKPNPRKSTWNNMMLYVREQVELYAFKRWGGEAELDKEFERREEEKKQRKAKKFKANLRDLRNRTRTSLWQRRDFDAKHVHEYGELVENPETGETEKTCQTCGLTIVVTEL